MVKSVSWMDTKTKEATLEKVDAVRLNIGFPNWILDKEALEEYYEDIDINGTNFLSDMVNVLGAFALLDLEYVGTEVDFNDTMDDPLDVNAYYVPQQNSIRFKINFLLFSRALNYGNLGCTLGHELTHGFDNSGRKFDKVGNLRQWWSNATVDEYVKRTKCFIHQFDTYKLDILKVNGTKTLPENLADDGGLRAAFMAYQNVLKHKTEDKLIGFEDFTQEQLFFLSYANSWCEAWTESYLHSIKGDEHAPNYYRLIGSLANNADFARTFNCPKGSRMNPKQEKCQIW
ncbi:Endothelin-converting enzyme [Blattella germanica]|nr:Endothelin-converting enzyme [Blattella germanica]